MGYENKLARRDFLKISALGVGALVFGSLHRRISESHDTALSSPQSVFSEVALAEKITPPFAEAYFLSVVKDFTNPTNFKPGYKGIVIRRSKFKENSSKDDEATAWALSRLLEASMDFSIPTLTKEIFSELDDKYLGIGGYKPNSLDFISMYHDDNNWIGLLSVRDGRIEAAKSVFDLVSKGWSKEKGGVFWLRQNGFVNKDINTVSTAGSAILALELYKKTREQKYLDWAKKCYDWLNEKMQDKDGLFSDTLGNRPSDQLKWTYNQGLMIKLNLIFYDVMKDLDTKNNYLEQANQIAISSLNFFENVTHHQESPEYKHYINNPEYNAIYFEALLKFVFTTNSLELYKRATDFIIDYKSRVGKFYDWNSKKYNFDVVDNKGNYVSSKSRLLRHQASMAKILLMAEKIEKSREYKEAG